MEINMNDTTVNVNKICRACLLQGHELLSLMDGNNIYQIKYSDLYSSYCGIQVQKKDWLPQNICSFCLTTILNFHSFKLKCINSEQTLQDLKIKILISGRIDNDGLSDDNDQDINTSNENHLSHTNASKESYISVKYEELKTENTASGKDVFNTIIIHESMTEDIFIKQELEDATNHEMILDKANHEKLFQDTIDHEKISKNATVYGRKLQDTTNKKIVPDILVLEENNSNVCKVIKIKTKQRRQIPITAKSGDKKVCKRKMKKEYYCSFCDLKFQGLVQYIDHRKEFKHKKNRIFRCRICKEKLKNKKDLLSHLQSLHGTDEAYKCDICEQSFLWADNKTRHMRIHTGIKSHVCKVCGIGYYQSSSLKEHALSHEESRVCPQCGVIVKSSAYKNHISLHEENFKCKECDKVFPKRSALNKHNLVHEESVVCTYCREKIKTSLYKGHIIKHEGRFKCLECCQVYATKKGLGLHLKIHQPGENASKYALTEHSNTHEKINQPGLNHSKHALTDHLTDHGNKLNYLCDFCGKGFSANSYLQYHMDSHMDRKTFACKICGKDYASRMNLKGHLLLHSGTKKHKCDECGKKFTQTAHLKSHLRIHTGERPYSCPFCNKTFAHLTNFNVHKRLHTGETPYVCDICSKGFAHLTSMKKHRNTHTEKK